jgi:hypothetical protein
MIPIKQDPVLDITEVKATHSTKKKTFYFKTPRHLDDISIKNAFSISEF